MIDKSKSPIIQSGIFYLMGFMIILGLKFFYSNADVGNLKWILAPTARWAGFLGGITFEYDSYWGYINHVHRFVIAPSCSGVQFMIITIAVLIFSFVHRMKTTQGGMIWSAVCLVFSYLLTIFVNGFRIVLSVYLPEKTNIYSGWLTPERLHTITGMVIYFMSLCIIYHIAGFVSQKIAATHRTERVDHFDHSYPGQALIEIICKCLPPMFWYFAIALGIPFLNRAYQNDGRQFREYSLLMVGICLVITSIFCILGIAGKRLHRIK